MISASARWYPLTKAFELANKQGHFDVDAVSPQNAAARITVPVLLVHGEADTNTSPETLAPCVCCTTWSEGG